VKLGSDSKVHQTGYPLDLLASNKNEVLHKAVAVSPADTAYWNVTMNMLEKDVVMQSFPGKATSNVVIARNSQAAYLANHALSVKNSVVVPPLVENKAYNHPLDNDYITLPLSMWSDVKEAYADKLKDVSARMYDVSKMHFHLAPLPGVDPKAAAADLRNAFVSVEMRLMMGTHDVEGASRTVSNGTFESRPAAVPAFREDDM
jgi:hypothetical protein